MSAYKTPNDSIYLTNYTLVLIVVIKEFTLIYIKDIYSLTDSLKIICIWNHLNLLGGQRYIRINVILHSNFNLDFLGKYCFYPMAII